MIHDLLRRQDRDEGFAMSCHTPHRDAQLSHCRDHRDFARFSGERAFYYPSDKAIYRTRCGHGEKAERDFNARRIDEDGF
jgi:hypothetical protein